MKVIKPFFLGMLGGLVLGLLLLLGLYFSPFREDVYFSVDPEMADIRSKLDQYQDWLAQTDFRIAQDQNGIAGLGGGPSGDSEGISGRLGVSDSLRKAQTKAWRDYKGWRNHLGELARSHSKPTVDGFGTWIFSLRFWILPIAFLLALLPGLLFALRARSRFRPGRVKTPPKSARAQALSNFEDAIKKVARISEADRGQAAPPIPEPDRAAPVSRPPPPRASIEPPTAVLPVTEFIDSPDPGTFVDGPKKKEPETAPFPIPGAPASRDPGRETAFLQMGTPWGEPAGERIGNPASIIPPAKNGSDASKGGDASNRPGLSMEDEDARDPSAGTRKYSYMSETSASVPGSAADDGEETLGVMPPTTEVERVERRKEEVLKLARKGMTSSEISRRMRISQDQVEFIIRLRREKG